MMIYQINMRTKTVFVNGTGGLILVFMASVFGVLPGNALAANGTITKANNTTALNSTGS